MAETTAISWADSTWNPWIGCTKVSPGCDGCYAAVSTPARSLGVKWGAGEPRRRTSAANWKKPLAWDARPFVACMACGWRGERRETTEVMNPAGFHPAPGTVLACPKCGEFAIKEARRRVFCASLADVFDNEVAPEWREDLFATIHDTDNLDWLLLTKRIGNVERMLEAAILGLRARGRIIRPWDWRNVWLGASVVNQEEADRDIPKLLATPAAKRFVSYEPALGPVEFFSPQTGELQFSSGDEYNPGHLDWLIIGGESTQGAHKARPFDIAWARDTVRQCRAAGVPVFVKQLGSAVSVRNDSMEEWPDEDAFCDAIPESYQPQYQGERVSIRLKDRAGADPAEWPEDLRVQCFPE